MKRYLSIDWDYFINATMSQRNLMFPDSGNENLHPDIQNYVWSTLYASYPELRNIGVIPEVSIITNVLKKHRSSFLHHKIVNEDTSMRAMVFDSHKHIFNFISDTTTDYEKFEVYNIDFHHDLYCYRTGGEEVNCGNWGDVLKQQRPRMKYFWVKREDSDTQVLGGEADYLNCDMKNVEKMDFDYIFICKSGMWSPPHLDNKFIELANNIVIPIVTYYQQGILEPRVLNDVLIKAEQDMIDSMRYALITDN